MHRLAVEHGIREKALRHLDVDLMIALPCRAGTAQLRPAALVERCARTRRNRRDGSRRRDALYCYLDGIVVIAEITRAQSRHDTVLMQKISRRSDQLSPSQGQLGIIRESQDGLHRTLSKGGAADDNGPSDIL
jgi:hypothetical protein